MLHLSNVFERIEFYFCQAYKEWNQNEKQEMEFVYFQENQRWSLLILHMTTRMLYLTIIVN